MDYVFRKAEKSDSKRIEELFMEMLRTIYKTDDVEGYEEGYLDRYFGDGEDLVYVAESGNDIVAFLSVQVYREDGYMYLDDLSVTEEHRGNGIGTKLIRMAESYSDEIDIPAIVFHVEKSNDRAHSLYKRIGYWDNEDQGNRIRMVKDKRVNNG